MPSLSVWDVHRLEVGSTIWLLPQPPFNRKLPSGAWRGIVTQVDTPYVQFDLDDPRAGTLGRDDLDYGFKQAQLVLDSPGMDLLVGLCLKLEEEVKAYKNPSWSQLESLIKSVKIEVSQAPASAEEAIKPKRRRFGRR